MEDKQLARLYDYTKFHIGIYLSFSGGIAALLTSQNFGTYLPQIVRPNELSFYLALALMALAGVCGGIVASSTIECETFDDFWNKKHGTQTFPILALKGRVWAMLEHLFFWTSLAVLAYIATLGVSHFGTYTTSSRVLMESAGMVTAPVEVAPQKSVPEEIKLWFEIAALFFGAVFLLTKLVYGQANAGMEVSVELERATTESDEDLLAVTLKLKRSNVGRLELNDVMLDIIDITGPTTFKYEITTGDVARERELNPDGTISANSSKNGLFLPPNDATQLGYVVRIKRGSVVRADATIVAKRTGFWLGKPQWRASAISLHEPDK